jgi:thioesterase domain-containing protein
MIDGPPRVFLLPGIFGDEAPLAGLRAALAGRVEFDLLHYPDVDRPSGEIRDFVGIVERTIQRICSLQPTDVVHIAGYSFGGLVGFEVACRLQAEGRDVGMLALLDSRALTLKVPGSSLRAGNRDAAPGAWGVGADFASRLLIAAGFPEAVRASIEPVGKLFGVAAARGLRRLLLQNLRGRALRDLNLGQFNGELLLFRAHEQPVPELPSDLGWGAHCAKVRSIPLHGNHTSLFRADHLADNAEWIAAEMEKCIVPPTGGAIRPADQWR